MTIGITPSNLAVNVGGEISPAPGKRQRMSPVRREATSSVVDSDGRPAGELLSAAPPNVGEANAGSQETGQAKTKAPSWPGRWCGALVTSSLAGTPSTSRRRARNHEHTDATISVHAHPVRLTEPVRVDLQEPVRVDLQRADIRPTADMALWDLIKLGTQALSFRHYAGWMEFLFCDTRAAAVGFLRPYPGAEKQGEFEQRGHRPQAGRSPSLTWRVTSSSSPRPRPSSSSTVKSSIDLPIALLALSEQTSRELGLEPGDNLRSLWRRYVEHTGGMLPYLDRVRLNLARRHADRGVAWRASSAIRSSSRSSPTPA